MEEGIGPAFGSVTHGIAVALFTVAHDRMLLEIFLGDFDHVLL